MIAPWTTGVKFDVIRSQSCSFEYPANIISNTVFFLDDEKEGTDPLIS